MHPFVTDHRDWLDDVSSRLSGLFGQSIRFLPKDQTVPSRSEFVSIQDSDEIVGCLSWKTPSSPPSPLMRPVVELVTEAASRLAETSLRLATRRRELQTLVEIGEQTPSHGEVSGSLEYLLRVAAQLGGYWTAAFLLIHPGSGQLQLRAAYHLAPEDFPLPHRTMQPDHPDVIAMERGRLVITRDSLFREWLPAGARLGVCVPVRTKSTVIGTLWCYDRRKRSVSPHDVDLLRSVAGQFANVLEQFALRWDSTTHDSLRRELKHAGNTPTGGRLRYDRLPRIDYDLALRSDSVREVTGDLCEILKLNEDQTLIAIGDAVGHSIPAALVMSTVRGALSAILTDAEFRPVPREIVRRLNQALSRVTRGEQFMTVIVAILDRHKGTLTYTNAGHPLPYLIRQGEVIPGQPHGLLLGVSEEANYDETQIALRPSDLLVLLTDGVTEAVSRSKTLFAVEPYLHQLPELPETTVDEVADLLWSQLQRHLTGSPYADDRTLLVVQIPDATTLVPVPSPHLSSNTNPQLEIVR